jgi:hypothetical protein
VIKHSHVRHGEGTGVRPLRFGFQQVEAGFPNSGMLSRVVVGGAELQSSVANTSIDSINTLKVLL